MEATPARRREILRGRRALRTVERGMRLSDATGAGGRTGELRAFASDLRRCLHQLVDGSTGTDELRRLVVRAEQLRGP